MVDRYDKVEQSLDKVASKILLGGPMTVYEAYLELQSKSQVRRFGAIRLTPNNPPLATVHTHFKILVDEGELIVYESVKTGRKQKYYGFTPYGFLMAFGDPTEVAKKNFKRIMKIWLKQEKFKFFLPKDEVLAKIELPEIELHLANICQMVASAFPAAQDVADYLRELGYGEFSPSQIIDFAATVASSAYSDRFLESSKVLAHHFPIYRENIRRFIEKHEQWLAMMRKELVMEEA